MITKEQKQLLLKDLCARLPYGTQVVYNGVTETLSTLHIFDMTHIKEEYVDIKPYLRPMSSMTEEEMGISEQIYKDGGFWAHFDWLNEHHFDYRIDPSTGKTLIESGLAIEAPKGMYKTK